MKKSIWVFSLAMLLFSTFAPSFTYALEPEEEAMEILSWALEDAMEWFQDFHWVASVLQSSNDDRSIYAEPDEDGNPYIIYNANSWLITVYSKDYAYWVTLQDRDLWADSDWKYGDYYKWWNDEPYSTASADPSLEINDNAWWWWTDNSTNYTTIVRWYSTYNHAATNPGNRQWPCDEWYHVPSAWEWNELIKLYYNAKDMNDKLIYNNYYTWASWAFDEWLNFIHDLNLNLSWVRKSWNGTIDNDWIFGNYWSSSPRWDDYDGFSWVLYISKYWNVEPFSYNNRSNWASIRCFKNAYVRYPKTIVYNANWGFFSWGNELKQYIYQYNWTQIIDLDVEIPNKNNNWGTKWMFAWWFTKSWEGWDWWNNFLPGNASASDIAYAKWLPFNDLTLTMSWVTFTIADRNLWASAAVWDENTTLNDQSWKFYFWKKLNLIWWMDIHVYDENNQWPCPNWYHIPNYYELLYTINIFKSENNKSQLCDWYSNIKDCFLSKLKIPLAWNYNEYSVLYNANKYAYFYTSSNLPDEYNDDPYIFYSLSNSISDSSIWRSNWNGARWWYPIRCFKNNSFNINWVSINNLVVDPNNWEVNKEHQLKIRETILPLDKPIRKWYKFNWWIYEWTDKKVSENDLLSNNTKIIWNWEKNPWYYYNANWWKFEWDVSESVIKYDFNENKTLKFNKYVTYWTNILRYEETITWASKLHVTLKQNKYPWYLEIYWYTWGKTDNTISNDYVYINGNNYEESFDVDWDKVVIIINQMWPSVSMDWIIEAEFPYTTNEYINIPWYIWHEFIWWYEENSWIPFDFENTPVIEDKILYAHWKSLEEKSEESTTENVVYTNNTTVAVWNETTEEVLSWSTTLKLVSKEVESEAVKTEDDKTTVQESEIKVTSDKTVEYEWGIEVYLEKTENEQTEKVEWTIKFSAPVAVKIPIVSDAETVKVQVKHAGEEFGYKWLTLNPYNECLSWEAVNDKYNWEDVAVTWNAWERYTTIYTCSASTFVAYSENKKPVVVTPAAWGWRTIKQESKVTEQEHNSADTEKTTKKEYNNIQSSDKTETISVEQKVRMVWWKSLTRWEVAVMTNILLDIYPKLIEKRELNEVSEACENYVDEQNFTKDEKKAITRLCKLSIMWIHRDNNEPLDEFLVKQIATNWEFATVMDRVVANYTEKDLSVVKDALKKLEWDEENVVFGTVYDVFMSIKNIFG